MNIKVFALCAFVASVQDAANGQNAGSGAIGYSGNSGGAVIRKQERRRKKASCSCSGLESAHLESLSQVTLAVDILMEPIIEIYSTAAGNRRESYSINESMCRSFTIFKWAIIISLNAVIRSQTGAISIVPYLYAALIHLSEFQNAVFIALEQALLRRPASDLVAIVEFLQHRAQEGASGVIVVFFDAMKAVANDNSALLTCIESGRSLSQKTIKEMVDLFFRALRILLSYIHKIEFTRGEAYTSPSFQDIKSAIKAAFRIERSSFFGPVADVCRTNCED